MKTKKETALIVAALENEYPLAECFLDSENAWQLLVAVRLSAQCTDLRVNATTPALFAKFPSILALAGRPSNTVSLKTIGVIPTGTTSGTLLSSSVPVWLVLITFRNASGKSLSKSLHSRKCPPKESPPLPDAV